MLMEIPVSEHRKALDRCAEDLLWEAGVDRPPVDAWVVARRLGIEIASDRQATNRGRFARLTAAGSGRPVETIVLGPEGRPERRHFVIAHEIGEAAAQRVYDLLGVDPRETHPAARERVANALAGRLLAPTKWLRGLWREGDGDLLSIKDALATASHEVLARRLVEVVRVPMAVTITDQDRVAWRAWNLSGRAPQRLRLEIDCQRRAHSAGEPVWGDGRDEPHTLAGGSLLRVRAWPIHEPGWRREITVTEIVGDEPEWAYAA